MLMVDKFKLAILVSFLLLVMFYIKLRGGGMMNSSEEVERNQDGSLSPKIITSMSKTEHHRVEISDPEAVGRYLSPRPVNSMTSVELESEVARREICSNDAHSEVVDQSKLNSDLEYWRNQNVHQKVLADRNFKPLTARQVQGVEKLLFFAGYPRSGHSIVGSLLDAHPNIILSYAFFLFRGLMIPSGQQGSIEGLLRNKTLFFNTMYEKSYRYSLTSGQVSNKGYTLDVPGLWSGKFDQLKIIGDKDAASTTGKFISGFSHSEFKQRYDHLAHCTGVQLMAIHVIRNPFDMIATSMLYRAFKYKWKKSVSKTYANLKKNKYDNPEKMKETVDNFFEKAEAVKEMVPLCGMKVLEVHNEDIVRSPRKELQRLCHFLEVDCSEQYLQTCERKVFRNVSRTRDKVVWPADIKADVERRMKRFPFFSGYTFVGDFYNVIG